MSDILQIAQVIARQGGVVLMEGYGNVHHIQQKGAIDLVTEFDKRAEEVIISSIQQEFPDHAILTFKPVLNINAPRLPLHRTGARCYAISNGGWEINANNFHFWEEYFFSIS